MVGTIIARRVWVDDMNDDASFKKRMRELVDDGYITFDKLGRWRVTEKGLACLLACADRAVKIKRTSGAHVKYADHFNEYLVG